MLVYNKERNVHKKLLYQKFFYFLLIISFAFYMVYLAQDREHKNRVLQQKLDDVVQLDLNMIKEDNYIFDKKRVVELLVLMSEVDYNEIIIFYYRVFFLLFLALSVCLSGVIIIYIYKIKVLESKKEK